MYNNDEMPNRHSELDKRIVSLLAYIKGELSTNFCEDDSIAFLEWSKKKLSDIVKDRKEKELLALLKHCDKEEIPKIKEKKKKYLPRNYPYNLKIGDLVHVNYGFGYCSEISDGHYGIILSEIKANMYFVLPLSSEPLKVHAFYLNDLNLPNKDGILTGKKSYLRFDQLGHIHYRRLENINGCERKNIGAENLKNVLFHINKFLKIGIDI